MTKQQYVLGTVWVAIRKDSYTGREFADPITTRHSLESCKLSVEESNANFNGGNPVLRFVEAALTLVEM